MVENNCLREELCVMGRYRSAAFTRTSLNSYLLKDILQRRCTYVLFSVEMYPTDNILLI